MAGVSRPPLLLLLLILSALGPRISFLLAYSASTRATAQCSSNGENPSPARGSTFDQCDGYYDVAGLWDGPFTCNSSQYIYCCGTCSSRYCCQCRLLRLDQANCPRTRPEWDSTSATIHIGGDDGHLDDDEKYDLDRDRSNMVVYVVAGLIVGLLLAGVLGRMWLKRARRAGLRALHMPRSLSEILRPRPASSRDEEVKRQAMHLTQARDMPRALKNHSDPARVEAMHVTALVSPLAPAQSHQHLACPPTAFSQATQPDLSCYTTLSRMGDKELNDYYTQKRHLAELAACGTLPVSITNPIPPSGTRQSPARDRRHKAYGSTPALDEPRIAVVPRGVNGAIQVYPTLGRTRHDGPTVQNVGVGDLGRWRHAIEQDFRYRADVYGSTPTLNKESRALNQQLPHYPNDDFLDWYCTSRRCARHPAAHLGTPRRPQEQLYATTARTGISRSQAFGSTPALNRAGRGPPVQMGWPLRSQAQQLPPPSQHSDYLTGESSEDYEPLPATLSRPRRGHHHGHKRSFEEDDGSQVALATLPSRLRTRAAQPSRPPSSGSGTLTPDRPSSAWRNHGEIPTLPRGTGVRTPGYRALPPRKASVTDSSDAEPGRTWNAASTLAKRQAFAGRRHMTQEQQSLPVVSRPQVFPTKSRNEVTV